jgi:hypothetical protein
MDRVGCRGGGRKQQRGGSERDEQRAPHPSTRADRPAARHRRTARECAIEPGPRVVG